MGVPVIDNFFSKITLKTAFQYGRRRPVFSLALGVLVLILAVVGGLIFRHEQQAREERQLGAALEAMPVPLVDCLSASFTQTLARGGEIRFDILATPAGTNEDFTLKHGHTPAGVSVRLEPAGGDAYRVTLAATAAARQGSYNLTVAYEPGPASPYQKTRYCQYNLIVQ